MDQPGLDLLVCEGDVGQVLGKGALCVIQVGQMEHRPHPHILGGVDHILVVQRDERPLACKAIGEGRQIGEEGESALEQSAVDIGIGVSVDR